MAEFLETLEGVAAGGTALAPEAVAELRPVGRDSPLDSLACREREREVLMLTAEGTATARPPTWANGMGE